MSTFENSKSLLNEIYRTKILPCETLYGLQHKAVKFSQSQLTSNPMLLLLGSQGSGKSTFMKNVLAENKIFKGGDGSTTGFSAIVGGSDLGEDRIIPGQTAVRMNDFPFSSLQSYGSGFLSLFDVLHLAKTKTFLDAITVIDTPPLTNPRHVLKSAATEWYSYLNS